MAATVAACASGGPLAAQETAAYPPPSLGLMGGLTSAKLVVRGDGASVTLDARTGVAVGVSLTKQVGTSVFLEFDGLYAQKGFDASSGGESASLSLAYLEFPALARYRLGSASTAPFLLGGAAVSYRVSCSAGVSVGGVSLSEGCDDGVNLFDYGAVLGAGLASGPLSGSVRYHHGLGDVLDAAGVETRNRAFVLLVELAVSGT